MIGLMGVTGEVGKQTYLRLANSGVNLCLLVRDVNKVSELLTENVKARQFDFTKVTENVFDDIKSLLWVLPINHTEIELNEVRWLELAKLEGVQHIVKLSVMRVEIDDIFHHRTSDGNIENSGIAFTHLRPNSFMQNFNNYELDSIKNRHQIRFPAGLGKTSFIDTRDIASVAAEILLHPEDHVNKGYTLTGGEVLNYAEAAELFYKILNFKVHYVDTTESKKPTDQYKMKHPFYAAVKRGEFAEISGSVEQVLEHAPIRLVRYMEDYKTCFLDGKNE